MKNDPLTSPALSVISLIFETLPIAPLVSPTNVALLLIRPKYLPCASSLNDSISILRIVDDDEYVVGIVTDGL